MALVNYATREINAKIVYYGPGLSGKTTNIQYVFQRVKPKNKGKLISLSTQGDRTLFFDFLPVELGEIKGFKTRFHLYTVPGQVFYNSTRKLVLKGADGVIFVADSQKMMVEENLQSLENLKTNLRELGIKTDNFPIILQYNKQDLENAASVEEIDEYLNPAGLPWFAASAISGDGVLQTLTAMVKSILQSLKHESTEALNLESLEDEPAPRAAAPEESTVNIKMQEPIRKAPEISAPEISVPKVPAPAVAKAAPPPEPELPEVSLQPEPEPAEEEIHEAELHEEAHEPEAALAAAAPVLEEPELPPAAAGAPEADETAWMPESQLADINEDSGEKTQPLVLNEPDFDPVSEPEEAPELMFEQPLPEAEISDFGKTDFHVQELIEKEQETEAAAEPPILDLGETADDAKEAAGAEAATVVSAPAPEPPREPVNSGLPHHAVDDVHALLQVNAAQSFILPIRIRTLTGVKDVQLRVNVGIELSGEKIEDISAVEILKPVVREPYSPPPYKPSQKEAINSPAITADERPHRAPIKPKTELKDKDKDKKPNMFQKIFLGMK